MGARNATKSHIESNSKGPVRAVHGVNNPDPKLPRPSTTNVNSSSAISSAGLKLLLGVEGSYEPKKVEQPPSPQESAADALMQMMMNNKIPMPPPPQVMPMQQASASGFNFSYIKEGEEPEQMSQPPPPAMMTPMPPPAMMPQYFSPQGPPVHMMSPHMMPNIYAVNNQSMRSPPALVARNGTTQAHASRPIVTNTTFAPPAKKAEPMVPSVIV